MCRSRLFHFLVVIFSATLLQTKAQDRRISVRSSEGKAPTTRDTRTLASFPDVTPLDAAALTKYGGLSADRLRATGFFRVEKLGERWWMIDPDGGRFIFTGVCSLNGSHIEKGGIAAALDILRSAHFKGCGGFSNHQAIRAAEKPLPYTVTLNLMSRFGKSLGLTHIEPGHTGYADDCIPVFDPGFEAHCAEVCRTQLAALKDDPWLVGVFSDNELPMPEDLLDRMLKRPGAPRNAALAFLAGKSTITDELRRAFIEHVFDTYFRITTKAIREVLPHHLCLGSRFHGRALRTQAAWTASGRWCDAISVNYYGQWTPQKRHLTDWLAWSGKPCLVTEFYVKGADSGLPNTSGAGWIVPTQADRGAFYQNFALALLESKSCVGWHWFKYMDNDPANTRTDPSNRDSNKGIVNLRGEPYRPLLDAMRELNARVYPLIMKIDAHAE
jgi:hypothetical protein